jgi:acyl-CoA dehydrogenase
MERRVVPRQETAMDFTLTTEQQLMIDTARRLGEKFGPEYWCQLDARKEYPSEVWREICSAGLAGVALPEELGGSGLGMLEMAFVIEALCAGGAGSTLSQMFMLNPIFGGVAVSRYGTAEMKRTLLPGLVQGTVTFCMALTEPNAGSNSLEVTTFAERDRSGWRLNGRKMWITAVPQATKMLVVARTKRVTEVKKRTEGISLFLIDVRRDGLDHTPIDKVGTNTLPSSAVFFDNVRVREDELVGTLDGGWPQLLDVLNTERIVTTAGLVGAGDLAIKLAVRYALDRKVFADTPIAKYQGLQFPLAQAFAELECARVMNHKAAVLFDQGQPFGTEANVAKLIAARAAAAATDHAMQTMGGMGYAKEFHVERLWRDARLFRIAPISEEMILNFVAVHNLGMPRSY